MSPAALGGPPHTRASALHGGGPIGTETGRKPSRVDGMAAMNRVFPHLDDLVSVKPDINVHSPLPTILKAGESYAKGAETNMDFRRPDLALEEHIKATTVALDIVPRHKDYVAAVMEKGESHRLFMGLTKRLQIQWDEFVQVKELIKQNNDRHGTVPKASKILSDSTFQTSNGLSNGHSRTQSTPSPALNGAHSSGSANLPVTPPKQKPPIQPKPDALHGTAIQSTGTGNPADLASRFARLRGQESNGPVQDPRIRTQPISIPGHPVLGPESTKSPQSGNYTINRPTGPREMPSVPTTAFRPKLNPLDVPSMPKAPDPIYNSPARNSDAGSTANLPSSAPRTSSYIGNGRMASAPPISTVRGTPAPVEDRPDYFTPAHSVNGYSATPVQRVREIIIPDSTTIKAEDLYEYLKMGSHSLRILLVDLRSREHFESGHIMSQSIICVEPITLRHGVSGEELGDTLVIASDFEQTLYQKRNEFDLVVFYDQSSSSLETSSPSGNSALQQFATAVYDYGYDKRLKRPPMLLVGGLDAWIDLLGQNSLQVSYTGTPSSNPILKPKTNHLDRPLGRVAVAKTHRPSPPIPRRVESRPLTKDEESRWDEVVRGEQSQGGSTDTQASASDELYYARTTDDFMRRYPEVSTIQESMVSIPKASLLENSFSNDLVGAIPRPPARPPPALPRQRSSGISDRGIVAHVPAHAAGSQNLVPPARKAGLTGIYNPGNLCYFNSVLQALSVTPFIRDFCVNFAYPPQPPLPRKAGEESDPPQLLVRNLKNLFFFLWSGYYVDLSPRTLHRYINAVHIGSLPPATPRNDAFGGGRQHDAAEFLTFMIQILEDETNYKRNVVKTDDEKAAEANVEEIESNDASAFVGAQRSWNRVLTNFNSIITRELKGQSCDVMVCNDCQSETRKFDTFTQLEITIPTTPTGTPVASGKLIDWINSTYAPGEVEVNCDSCKAQNRPWNNRKKTSRIWLTYLPNYLILNLKRFRYTDASGVSRVMSNVNLPQNGQLDLTQLFIGRGNDINLETTLLPGQVGPFLYDIYATVHHSGSLAQSGHYWTTARNLDKSAPLNQWHKYDDSAVTECTMNVVGGKSAYSILLRRHT
ncbi:Ubiquitin carboxyl-terminal hydrolase [Lachnellula suecica]|uniref:Ubiquitin carboxyl-terminal hydrolase n=1 Tax=Lachnellula suecica TaxID=602035 RepID=A0A8T9BVM0_9HELO|nr:Ubiquitin carboxyl-terminal hydrolase [Lachnellula suecica]